MKRKAAQQQPTSWVWRWWHQRHRGDACGNRQGVPRRSKSWMRCVLSIKTSSNAYTYAYAYGNANSKTNYNTPTPTEEPGFEAVFTNFFASQKPLLKMLHDCRAVSSGIFGAEKEEEVKRAMQKAKCKKQKQKSFFWGRCFFFPFLFIFNTSQT